MLTLVLQSVITALILVMAYASLIARLAKDSGAKGIVLDTEQYSGQPFNYTAQPQRAQLVVGGQQPHVELVDVHVRKLLAEDGAVAVERVAHQADADARQRRTLPSAGASPGESSRSTNPNRSNSRKW